MMSPNKRNSSARERRAYVHQPVVMEALTDPANEFVIRREDRRAGSRRTEARKEINLSVTLTSTHESAIRSALMIYEVFQGWAAWRWWGLGVKEEWLAFYLSIYLPISLSSLSSVEVAVGLSRVPWRGRGVRGLSLSWSGKENLKCVACFAALSERRWRGVLL